MVAPGVLGDQLLHLQDIVFCQALDGAAWMASELVIATMICDLQNPG